jgi:hypothetical protein
MARAHGSIAQWLMIGKQVCGHAVRWYRQTLLRPEPCRHHEKHARPQHILSCHGTVIVEVFGVIPFGVARQPSAEAPVQF